MARAFIHELLKAEAERIKVKQNTYPEPSLAEGNECTGVTFSSIFSFSSDPFKVNIKGGNLAFGNFPSPRNNSGSGGSNFNPSTTEFLRGLEKFPNAYLPPF